MISDHIDFESARALLSAFLEAEQALDGFRHAELERAGSADLVGWQSRVLAALCEAGAPRAYAELVEALEERFHQVNKPTITQTLTKLGKANYVILKESKHALSEKGRRAGESVVGVERAVLAHFLAAIPRGMGSALVGGIDKWATNFRQLTSFAESRKPTPAGIYDAMVGGGLNSAIERISAEGLTSMLPWARSAALTNRAFLVRAVTHLARDHGVDQLIDVGAGLPGRYSTYGVATEYQPDPKVLYLDADEGVVNRGNIILKGCQGAQYRLATFESLDAVLAKGGSEFENIDLRKPVAILLVALLHFVPSDAVVHAVLEQLRSHLKAGSFLVISHGCQDPQEMDSQTCDIAADVVATYEKMTNRPLRLRTCQEITQLFDGWDTAPLGLQFAPKWKSDIDHPFISELSHAELLAYSPERSLNYVGVGKLA